MSNCNNCPSGLSYNIVAPIAAAVFGVLTGFAFALGLLVGIVTVVWTALLTAVAFGVAGFVYVVYSSRRPPRGCNECLCRYTGGIAAGTVGTLVTAVTALALALVPLSPIAIAVVALLGFFLALLLLYAVLWFVCSVKALCREDDDDCCGNGLF